MRNASQRDLDANIFSDAGAQQSRRAMKTAEGGGKNRFGCGTNIRKGSGVGVQNAGKNLNLTWPQGTVIKSPNLNGPWSAGVEIPSPLTVRPGNNSMLYRVCCDKSMILSPDR
jgi:hypothetical protein